MATPTITMEAAREVVQEIHMRAQAAIARFTPEELDRIQNDPGANQRLLEEITSLSRSKRRW